MSETYTVNIYDISIFGETEEKNLGLINKSDANLLDSVFKIALECADVIVQQTEGQICEAEEKLQYYKEYNEETPKLAEEFRSKNKDLNEGIIPDGYTKEAYEEELQREGEEVCARISNADSFSREIFKLEVKLEAYKEKVVELRNSRLTSYQIAIDEDTSEIAVAYVRHPKKDDGYHTYLKRVGE